jgi:hypothetical protein
MSIYGGVAALAGTLGVAQLPPLLARWLVQCKQREDWAQGVTDGDGSLELIF